jgi:hypothetical protein
MPAPRVAVLAASGPSLGRVLEHDAEILALRHQLAVLQNWTDLDTRCGRLHYNPAI